MKVVNELIAGVVAVAGAAFVAEVGNGATLTVAASAAGTAVLVAVVKALNPKDESYGLKKSE